MNEELIKKLDDNSLMELLRELAKLDWQCETIINKEGVDNE